LNCENETIHVLCLISGFSRGINEICALLGFYATKSSLLPTFRDIPIFKSQAVEEQSALTSWPLNMGQIDCSETSVRNYHYMLRKIPERAQI